MEPPPLFASYAIGTQVVLEGLSLEEARALAVAACGAPPADEAEAAALSRVVDEHFGGLPIAIEVAARAVAGWAGTWAAYEALLPAPTPEELAAPDPRGAHYPRAVLAAVDLAIDRCGDGARRLLEGAAVFAAEAPPLAWMLGAAGLAAGSPGAEEACAELESRALMRVAHEGGTVALHRVVRQRARDRADAGRLGEICKRAVATSTAEASNAGLDDLRRIIGEAERVLVPTVWCALAGRLAAGLRERGAHGEARALLERALDVQVRATGPDHPHLAVLSSELASLAMAAADREGAARLRARALAVDEKAYGADHPQVALRLAERAADLLVLDQTTAARPLLERALSIEERAHGPDDPRVAPRLAALAAALPDEEARPLLERAVRLDEAAPGAAPHREAARCLASLGRLVARAGALAEARALLERALDRAERGGRDGAAEVVGTVSDLAGVMVRQGSWREARALMEQALRRVEEQGGSEPRDVAGLLSGLARVMLSTGEPAAARRALERAVAIDERALGKGHWITALRRAELAAVAASAAAGG